MNFCVFKIFLVLFLSVSIVLNFTNGENSNDIVSATEESNLIAKHSSEYDEILSWESPYKLKKNLPYFLSGFDEDGCPIWIAEYGKWDVRGQIDTFGFEQVQEYMRQVITTMYTSAERERVKELVGNNQTEVGACESLEFNIIIDLDEFSHRQLGNPQALTTALNLVRTMLSLEGKSERLKGITGINSNYLGNTLYSFVAPFLGSLANKITVSGTNPDRWKPSLLKMFPKSALPSWMGGFKDFKPVRVYG